MDTKPTFKDRSKQNWNGDASTEHINAGSLQRIADATEKMAANYDQLVSAKKAAENSRDYWKADALRLERRCRSLRGYITRLKRRGSL